MSVKYPHVIQSDMGGRWVYSSNRRGEFFVDGYYVAPAGPKCEEVVGWIECDDLLWRGCEHFNAEERR